MHLPLLIIRRFNKYKERAPHKDHYFKAGNRYLSTG